MEKVYIVFNASDGMECVCKTKELAKEICENKITGLYYYKEVNVKTDTRCPHFRNDDGCSWCENDFWVISNKDNSDCERNCKDRYEIRK